MSAVRQDTTRLQAENSQLHIRLIQEAEKYDRQEKIQYQLVKKLEDRIAELSYWKQSAAEKLMAADRENAGLRKKMDGLVNLNDRLTSGVSLCHVGKKSGRCLKSNFPVASSGLTAPEPHSGPGSMDPQAIAPKISSPYDIGM